MTYTFGATERQQTWLSTTQLHFDRSFKPLRDRSVLIGQVHVCDLGHVRALLRGYVYVVLKAAIEDLRPMGKTNASKACTLFVSRIHGSQSTMLHIL